MTEFSSATPETKWTPIFEKLKADREQVAKDDEPTKAWIEHVSPVHDVEKMPRTMKALISLADEAGFEHRHYATTVRQGVYKWGDGHRGGDTVECNWLDAWMPGVGVVQCAFDGGSWDSGTIHEVGKLPRLAPNAKIVQEWLQGFIE